MACRHVCQRKSARHPGLAAPDTIIDQRVMDHRYRPAQALQRTDGQQGGIPGTRTHEPRDQRIQNMAVERASKFIFSEANAGKHWSGNHSGAVTIGPLSEEPQMMIR